MRFLGQETLCGGAGEILPENRISLGPFLADRAVRLKRLVFSPRFPKMNLCPLESYRRWEMSGPADKPHPHQSRVADSDDKAVSVNSRNWHSAYQPPDRMDTPVEPGEHEDGPIGDTEPLPNPESVPNPYFQQC